MRILAVGPLHTTTEYRLWIQEELSVDVDLLESLDTLETTLESSAWDLLVLESVNSEYRVEEVLRTVKLIRPLLPAIAICGDNPQDAIEVMRLGVSDYLVKPVDKRRLSSSVQEVLGIERSDRSREESFDTGLNEREEDDQQPLTGYIIFEGSDKMAAIGQVVEKILNVDLPVLITGESGTGKEIVAKYIHNKSSRNGPFIKVNCAAIPSELLESELFGYERGAFTGAYRRKPGKFEAASGGFLFLDEISELPYSLQSKLLHALQDGTVSSLGSNREVKVDARILVASNQDLESCVRNGTFRDDLYFRLNVVHINVPPLRERLKQLDILIGYFTRKFAKQYNTHPVHLDDDERSFLFSYHWPGNIRELENTIRRATILGGGIIQSNISCTDQPLSGSLMRDTPATEKQAFSKQPQVVNRKFGVPYPTMSNGEDESVFSDGLNLKEIAKEAALAAEKEAIARVLQETRWNRKKTAQILSVSYKTLLTKIKETGLDEN